LRFDRCNYNELPGHPANWLPGHPVIHLPGNPAVLKIPSMNWIEVAGLVGAFLSSVTFIPQVYRVWKTKGVNDLSLAMIVIVFSSTIIWLVYGVALMLWPVILANSIICGLSLMLIYFKLAYTSR
jgi:MtN3 and saliva related transmembrane protein